MASLPHTTLALCDHVQRFAYDRVGVGLDSSPHALATAARSLADFVLGDVVTTPPADEYAWQWWSGSSEEWFEHGPFATRDHAVAELLGQGGYVVEATPAVRVSFSAATLIEAQYLEDNDAFDCDHCEPDRIGSAAVVAAADAKLQALLDAWCDRFAHTFVRGNLFSGTRNAERVEAVAQHQPTEVI